MSFDSFVLLPNITGVAGDIYMGNYSSGTGALTSSIVSQMVDWGKSGNTGTLGFDASRSNTIYNESKTVQPQSLVLNHIVKY